jgi:hypothetical protein
MPLLWQALTVSGGLASPAVAIIQQQWWQHHYWAFLDDPRHRCLALAMPVILGGDYALYFALALLHHLEEGVVGRSDETQADLLSLLMAGTAVRASAASLSPASVSSSSSVSGDGKAAAADLDDDGDGDGGGGGGRAAAADWLLATHPPLPGYASFDPCSRASLAFMQQLQQRYRPLYQRLCGGSSSNTSGKANKKVK